MANAFDAYQRARAGAMQQGQNMLAMQQAVDKIQRQRQMQDILGQNLIQAQPAMPDLAAAPAQGPLQPGAAPLPDYPAQAGAPAVPGGFDISGATQQLLAKGFIHEAMQMKAFQPKPQPGFTLGEGQVRFGPSGEVIARGPAKEKKPGLTPGQEAVDKKFSKEYVDFTASGGFADIQKQLGQLDEVSKALDTKNLTGAVIGRTPDVILSATNPDAIAARDTVEEVVQRNLRLILGAQFTEKEGERLIARAYNPRLDEKENKKRLGRLIKQIKTAAQQKQRASEYFEKNGTLTGFKGHIPTLSDFGGGGQSNQDKEALKWANANPNDPRAMQILQRLGAQ